MQINIKKTILFFVVFSLFAVGNLLQAQQWHYYNPTAWFDVNAVEIPGPGVIAIGGGQETRDSVQVMFQSPDYGLTWFENQHDGLAPWNKSIAFSDSVNGYGVGYDGRIIKSTDAGLNWGWAVAPIHRDFNKIFYAGNGTYYVAGGNKTNDSIQTILKSTDFGNSWNVIYDTLGPWLKSIYFTDTLKGFAVGDNGVILSTTNGGITWTSIAAPVQRDFNAITFINNGTGYIVGGTPIGLCRRTILRTVNGGSNWGVLADTAGGILKDISFADAIVGYCVGDSATVLKTTDGGLNWVPVIVDTNHTGIEAFNAVKFYDRNFGAIGGKAGVLYIYLNFPIPVVHTFGASFLSTSQAELQASINTFGQSVRFSFCYSTDSLFSTFSLSTPQIFTSDSLALVTQTINNLIPDTIYYFYVTVQNPSGMIYGDTLNFSTSKPYSVLETQPATVNFDTTVTLYGKLSGFLVPVAVSFEYGTTNALGNEITANPNSVSDTLFHTISVRLNNLVFNTVYFYRLKVSVSGGINFYGNIRQVYIGDNRIPNWDFENWQDQSKSSLIGWSALGNMGQSISYDGSKAIYLYGNNSFPFGMAYNGYFELEELAGGVPFTAQPDSFVFYANYNIAMGDTAFAIEMLSKDGNFLTGKMNPITGNSGGSFVRFSFPIVYQGSAVNPDTLFLGFASSNINSWIFDAQSWLKIDNISFTGTTQNIPDPGCENWSTTLQYDLADGWSTAMREVPITYFTDIPVTKTTDACHGNYAIRFQNDTTIGFGCYITTDFIVGNFHPSFAVNRKCEALNGYFKFLPQNDTLSIMVNMFKNGQTVGGAFWYISTPFTSYTPLDIPINYSDPDVIPDSATIYIRACKNRPNGNSVVYIDDLSFDGFYLSDPTHVSVPEIKTEQSINAVLSIYPNPSNDKVYLDYYNPSRGILVFSLFDIYGKLLYYSTENTDQPGTVTKQIDISPYSSGIYLISVASEKSISTRKLIIHK